jgi:ketosteroid isomerase-like protein
MVGTGVPGAGTHKGRDRVLRVIGSVRRLFEPGYPKGEVYNEVTSGEWAAAEARARSPMRDGRAYENHYAFFIRVPARAPGAR